MRLSDAVVYVAFFTVKGRRPDLVGFRRFVSRRCFSRFSLIGATDRRSSRPLRAVGANRTSAVSSTAMRPGVPTTGTASGRRWSSSRWTVSAGKRRHFLGKSRGHVPHRRHSSAVPWESANRKMTIGQRCTMVVYSSYLFYEP